MKKAPKGALFHSGILTEKAELSASFHGASLRFSAGLGSNHLLAKIAGKLEKPDGCKHLWACNMPDAVAHLKPDDLPGISTGTMRKLAAAGITSISQLYHMDPRHARAVWGSIEGERFVRALQGEQVELPKTERGGYGSSKVLSPDFRAPKEAYLVGRWLVEKATGRLRGDGRVASEFSLSMRFLDGSSWGRSIRCEASQAWLARSCIFGLLREQSPYISLV